jgi:voltage-gated potassium channel
MSGTTGKPIEHGNAYNTFILLVTLLSLILVGLQLLPFSSATKSLLRAFDTALCAIFLADFLGNLYRAPSRKEYFVNQRGWLDLLGSIPAVSGAEGLAILRLARLSRLARLYRLYRGQSQKRLVADLIQHRAQYAGLLTILSAMVVLMAASIIVLNAESRSDSSNIRTGGDAIWWAFVTLTTVGYGDRFPVTTGGRVAATFVMIAGIGIIAAMASIMASLLLGGSESSDSGNDKQPAGLELELARISSELAALRLLVAQMEAGLRGARTREEE